VAEDVRFWEWEVGEGENRVNPFRECFNLVHFNILFKKRKKKMIYGLPANIWYKNTGHDRENNDTQHPNSDLK